MVSDAGLKHLKGLTKLTKLDLSRTNVTAQGIADLKKVLPECDIKWDGEAPPKPKAMTEDEAREALAGLFAERLELAGDTEEKDDDIAVATSMLEMAEEKDVAPALRAVLCEKVFELAGQEPKGFAAAVAAMDLMAEHDAEQADVYRIKAISLYAGRFGAVEEEQRPAAALGLIRLLQGYARRSEEAGDLARARAHILQAARTARVVELPQALLLEDKVRRLDERARARTEAEELATKLEETPDDQLLHRQLMNLHLLSLDDPAVALEHVDLAGESESRHFLELAAEVAGGLGELDLLMVGRWYRSLAEDVREGRQQTALERANEVYTWYLARHRDDDAERATAQAEREEIETALAEPRSEDADRKPGGPWTSLLAFASASAEAADGERWQVDDGGLSGSGKIFLPLHPEGSYRVRLRFHPPQDTGWEMRVPIGGRSVPVYIRPDQVVAVGKPLDVQGDPLLSPARLEELELTVLRRGEQILVAVDLNGSPYGFGQIQIPAEVEGVEDEPAPAGFVVIGRNISMAAAEIRMVDGWMRLLAADGP
ncbi:MAG: hypothetical protein OER86_13640 [Phycisphaerae bacterium]|nr:hypothetical protein [Phycisphaerae bacterium]